MIIVTGHLRVDPRHRAVYVDACREIVRLARLAPGCLDFALGADLVDDGRVNILERWRSRADVEDFRTAGPPFALADQILDADVEEYDVS